MKKVLLFLSGYALTHIVAAYCWFMSGRPFERGAEALFVSLAAMLIGAFVGAMLVME